MYVYQVSDVENILGIVQHSENIQIIAEAYDIAVDITIPEGTSLKTAHWLITPSHHFFS